MRANKKITSDRFSVIRYKISIFICKTYKGGWKRNVKIMFRHSLLSYPKIYKCLTNKGGNIVGRDSRRNKKKQKKMKFEINE